MHLSNFRYFLVVFILSWMTGAARADVVRILLTNGTHLLGEAIVDREKQAVSLTTDEGVLHRLSFEELEGESLYYLLSRTMGEEDEKGRLELALLARDRGLYDKAVKELKALVEHGGDWEKEGRELLEECVGLDCAERLDTIRENVKAGQEKKARNLLKELREDYPDSDALKEAETLLQKEKKPEPEKKRSSKEERLFGKVGELWETMRLQFQEAGELAKQGLQYETASYRIRALDSYDKAEESYRDCIKKGKEIEKLCDKYDFIREEFYANKEKKHNLKSYLNTIEKKLVNLFLNEGALYLADERFIEAKEACNKALVLEEDNREAVKLKIEIARRESAAQR